MMGVGAIVPILAPLAIPFMLTGKTGGSGAGPAIACGLAAFAVILGGAALLGGAGLAALFSFGGVPWFVTVPVVYFGIFGILGATVFHGK